MIDRKRRPRGPHTRLLADIADILESSADADGRIRQVLRMMAEAVPYDACAVLESRHNQQRFIVVPDAAATEPLRSALLNVLAELSDEPSHPVVVEAVDLGSTCHAAVPLVGLDRTIGVLVVTNGDEHQYDEDELSVLAVVGAQLASYLTNLSLAEQAASVLRMRNEFLASISHDLRTPLTAIKGHAQLLQRSLSRGAVDGQRIVNDLQSILEGATRMALQIDQVFAVAQSHIEEVMSLNLESVDLVALVRQCIEVLRPIHEGRILFEPAVQRYVGMWDAGRLRRACDNLLSNALKYSPGQQSVRVTVKADNRAAPGALLQVADHGIGIPEGDLPNIFEPFHRAANSGPFAGTGLGLAGTKATVERHGGTMSVVSEVGKGTIFSVWLPAVPPRSR